MLNNVANKSGEEFEDSFEIELMNRSVPYKRYPDDFLWGSDGKITAEPDFKIHHGRHQAFVELKRQDSSGSAEDKVYAIFETANNNDYPFIFIYGGRNKRFKDRCRHLRYKLINEPSYRTRHKNIIGIYTFEDFFKSIDAVYYSIDEWYVENNKQITTYSLIDINVK